MRINRGSLVRVIRNTVQQRTRSDRNIISIYLCGSLLEDEYEIGGTVDIDLFFIHIGPVEVEREIVRLTDEVHLDIAHHDQKDYRDTRHLRVHPWMGPNINNCEIYYDPGHFMDFTQASVRGQYDRPEYVLKRARTLADSARSFWFTYEMEHPEAGTSEIIEYLQALANSANAITSLSDPPLTERRFLRKFKMRTGILGRPGLYHEFMGLLGAQKIEFDTIRGWLPAWESAFDQLAEQGAPARLHPVRKQYYLQAFKSILESDQPGLMLWPFIHTWTQIVDNLAENSPIMQDWRAAFSQLGFLEDGFGERIKALDGYLDQIEETIDIWARSQGIG